MLQDRLDYIDWSITTFALKDNAEPMAWNLFLAFIPLVLSCILFNQPRSPWLKWGVWILLGITIIGSYPRFFPLGEFLTAHRFILLTILTIAITIVILIARLIGLQLVKSIFWWFSGIVFLLFLPNAAYILTDFIHLVLDIRKGYPMGTVMLFLIPQYLIFIISGFEAYTISIMNLEAYLRKVGKRKYILILEIFINFISAIGVYLGRFARFNSWDILTNLDQLLLTITQLFFSMHAMITIAILFLIFLFCQQIFKLINIGLKQQKDISSAILK